MKCKVDTKLEMKTSIVPKEKGIQKIMIRNKYEGKPEFENKIKIVKEQEKII